MTNRFARHGAVAILTAASFVFSQTAPLLGAPQAAAPARPAAAPARPAASPAPAKAAPAGAKPAASPAPPDGGWPRAYSTPSGGNIILYQPQMASWEQQKHMVA